MRKALVSVVVGLAGAGAVAAAAWGLQTAGLPPPTRADRIAADATRWLSEHRAIVDVFHVDRRRTTGLCLSGWFPLAPGRKADGSLLVLDDGVQYLLADRRIRAEHTLHRRARVPHIALAAGCGRSIAHELVPGEQTSGRLSSERAYAAGRPAVALEVHDSPTRHFTLYVAAGTYQPLVAIVHARGETATARLYLARLTPRLLARFDLSSRGGERR